MQTGLFIMIDGIDGSGKSTILNTWAEYLAKQGKKVFSLKSYWTEHHAHPRPEELTDYDVIVSAEPTSVWAGAAIRQEMIREGSSYSARAIAEAYALDRLVLYERVILPLRAQGKLILQDRGVSTSLCYQPLQDATLFMDDVAKIEGNAFALKHAPDHLVIAHTTPKLAMERLGGRSGKQDNAIFEKQDFLAKASERFLNHVYQAYFTKHGCRIHMLNTDVNLAIMKTQAVDFLRTLLA